MQKMLSQRDEALRSEQAGRQAAEVRAQALSRELSEASAGLERARAEADRARMEAEVGGRCCMRGCGCGECRA